MCMSKCTLALLYGTGKADWFSKSQGSSWVSVSPIQDISMTMVHSLPSTYVNLLDTIISYISSIDHHHMQMRYSG